MDIRKNLINKLSKKSSSRSTSKLINKFKRIYILLYLLLIVIGLSLISKVKASYELYLDQLRLMDISVDNYLYENDGNNDVISRYELAKLLNTVECKDCIHPASSMVEIYTKAFWESFIQLPGKDFDEISYLGGIYNQDSYYYCVAYVGDNNYMRGYPENISPICAGMFCGAKSVTKAEFIQVIINLLSDYIYPKYYADWTKIYKWTNKIKEGTQAYTYIDDTDRDLIKRKNIECTDGPCKLDNGSEFKIYLKYCMFNLKACEMQAFGKIGQAYWPVAELNILYNQNIIDYNEAQKDDIHSPAKGSVVLETLYNLYEFIDCKFDNDYDCDTRDNANDNCPNKYNPSQKDTNNNGIGDVCDDDIDGDGITNPIGIIDELGRLNIGAATTGMDNCLLTVNTDQQITKHPFIGDACFEEQDKVAIYISTENIRKSAPTEVRFEAVTKGTFKNIIWQMGDGTQLEGEQVTHYYKNPGLYTISATAHGTYNDAIAKTSLILGENTATYHGVQMYANRLGTDGPDNILFGIKSAGQIDGSVWTFGDDKAPVKRTSMSIFNKLFENNGQYNIINKTYLKGKKIGETSMTVGVGKGNYGLAIKSDKVQLEINKEINIQSNGYNFSSNDINYIKREFGDGSSEINKATNISHIYKSVGSKVIKQTTLLNNGITLTAYITIFVNDPTHTSSHVLQLTPNKLWLKKGEKSYFNMNPIGDSLGISHVLEYQSITFNTERLFSPSEWPIQSKPTSYYKGGLYHPKSSLIINECQRLDNEATIVVHGLDTCLEALLGGTLDQFSCDMDGDSIPDVCDNDIDGDGVENLIGIISYENEDCSITSDNIDLYKLGLHLEGVCTLDNCPFVVNSDQSDLNIDYIGDSCSDSLGNIIYDEDNNGNNYVGYNNDKDSDNDGITDSADQCPEIAENYNGINDLDGCPEIDSDINCIPYEEICDDILCPGPCLSCPCQFADYTSDLAPGDMVKATLFDITRIYFYNNSLPVLIDDYINFDIGF